MNKPSRPKLPAAIRHYWMLILAAGMGIALAREGSVFPVEARENDSENSPESTVSSDLTMDAEDVKNHTPLHRPSPEADLNGPDRVNVDQLTDFSKFEFPKLEP